MNLANMAAGRAPWSGPDPLLAEAALSLQLRFDMPAPPEPQAETPAAWSWTNEPRDSLRHGAELAALLVILQPVETCFLPLSGEAPPALEQAPPLPSAPPPLPALEPEPWMVPPPARLPPSEWLIL
jgi:hypothetical protein